MIVDLSIGAPNIAPAPHILKALSEACLVPENYLYAIQDQQALLEAVSDWYARRYGVELNPETEICSLLGSRLAHLGAPPLRHPAGPQRPDHLRRHNTLNDHRGRPGSFGNSGLRSGHPQGL